MKTQIELGDTVKDKYSGFVGIAVNKTEFINGCIQYGIVAKVTTGKVPEEVSIDSESLTVTKKGPRHEEERGEYTGGPIRSSPVQRGF